METPNDNGPRGIFGTLKSLVARVVALLHGRAQLFTTELEEEITRLVGVLIWGFVAAQCAVIGMVLVAATVLLVVPKEFLVWAAGGAALLFLAVAAVGGLSIRKIVRAKARPFDATLRELEKDRDRLRSGE
jgi:uncharacterized membrane protein YqjE